MARPPLIIRIRNVVQLQLTPRQLQQQMETVTERERDRGRLQTADKHFCQGYFNKSSSFAAALLSALPGQRILNRGGVARGLQRGMAERRGSGLVQLV